MATRSLPEELDGLVVGRLQSWKGPEVLCEALRRLGTAAPKIGWVGADTAFQQPGRRMSEHLVEAFPDVWGRKLVALGRRAPAEAASLQAGARFVVVPSTWDVFNLSAVEAMGYRRVVICSDGAGAAELIRDGINGFRFPAGDAAALADRLAKAIALSESQRNDMGEQAQATVMSELDPVRIADRRMQRYESLAARRDARCAPPIDGLFAANSPVQEPLAFLDRLPLRRIARYTLGRALRKFRRRPR
jgi:glycosyltransferase involved in cell wall biosynthesis